MIFLKKLLDRKKKISWRYTDFIISIDDIVYKVNPYFDKNNYYHCIRDFRGICIYVKENDFEEFKKNKDIYNEGNNIINLSNILNFREKYNIYADTYYKSTPIVINIKHIYYCKIYDIDVYITMKTDLTKDNGLFRDLVNVQIIKDKYNFI